MAGTFNALLSAFKSQEQPESLVHLLDDATLRNALVAWPSVSVSIEAGTEECPYEEEGRRWLWLWSKIKYDEPNFGVVADLKEHEVRKVLTRLIGLRLIYPDGSIHAIARQYIRGLIVQSIPKRPKHKDGEEAG